jgi:L-threonylcarbamoyladenylate synthase
MTRQRLDPLAPDPAGIAAAVAVLRSGGVVAYPTDTLYGLAVDPRNDTAVERLFAVKGRDAASAIALIAADAAMADGVAAGGFGPLERRLASAFWPGPLTIVVPAAGGMAALAPRGTLGVRVPAHLVARSLSAAFGACITATSANLTGRPPSVTADEVAATLGELIDFLVDAGPAPGGAPSTIVEVVEGRPLLHRAGAVAWDRVLEVLTPQNPCL